MRWPEISEFVIILVTVTKSSRAAIEGFIVGGEYAKIKNFPHSAFLRVSCDNSTRWICGASILNQRVLLTAAHCVCGCDFVFITIVVGNENRFDGNQFIATKNIVHEEYDPVKSSSDIALILVDKTLNLNKDVSRVALLEDPPMNKVAFIAGWGKIDEETRLGTELLKKANQTVMTRTECEELIGWIPKGCICGVNPSEDTYVSGGDSGSALVVDGYIQIGLVSHKYPSVSKQVIVYTEIAYFYSWIVETTRSLYCQL